MAQSYSMAILNEPKLKSTYGAAASQQQQQQNKKRIALFRVSNNQTEQDNGGFVIKQRIKIKKPQ